MFPADTAKVDGSTEAPVLQHQKSQEMTLRPSFFVGNGGTGHLILLYLKAIFLKLHGTLPEAVRMVVFDTADENLTISLDGQQIALERGTEFRYTGKVDVAGIIQHIDNHPHIRDRLPQIMNLPPVNLLDGASQVRPLGLLALLWHIDIVKQALEDPLWELANRDNLGTLDGLRIDASRGINVFQIGSLCGGTNSGQFIDTAYLLRTLLKKLGLDRFSEIIGVGVLPNAFRKVRGPNLIPNTVAALHELDHCMVKGGFEASYRDGSVVDTHYPPFNIYYLLSAVDENNRVHLSLNELCWSAAMGLYHLAMTPIGNQQNSMFANLSEALTHRTDDGHGTFFASFGLAELSFPAEDVAKWCSYQHAQDVIRHGLLAAPDDGDAAQRAVEATVQHQELTGDGLVKRLAVDDTGFPLAVELHPPARIQDAEPTAVPQIVLNYVQNYQRERVEGDYSIWVRENAAHFRASLRQHLSEYLQQAVDDPARGPLFARAFAQNLSQYLADLAARLTARRQSLEAEQRNLESDLGYALDNLMQAAEPRGAAWLFNWLLQGDNSQELLDRYLRVAQESLQAQFDLVVLKRALAVVVAAQEHLDAWARDVETLIQRLQAVAGELTTRQRDLTAWLFNPAKVTGLALLDQAYLERLYQTHAPPISATVDVLFTNGEQAPHRWIDGSQNEVEAAVVRAARRPFAPIRGISVEQVIQERSDRMSARQWVETLLEKAQPAWNLNEVLLPDGDAHLARIELIGVPNREQSIYAGDGSRLVSTSDPQHITAFAMTAGAPFTAVRSYEDLRRSYERVRGRRPLHILPDFLADGQSAQLAFALGYRFGFINDRGVYYYYQPIDDLEAPIQLGRGKQNAIETLGGREGLVREVMQRVEARIEDIGYEQAQQDLADFYKPTGDEDAHLRELKRLVRSYAQKLEERRLQ